MKLPPWTESRAFSRAVVQRSCATSWNEDEGKCIVCRSAYLLQFARSRDTDEHNSTYVRKVQANIERVARARRSGHARRRLGPTERRRRVGGLCTRLECGGCGPIVWRLDEVARVGRAHERHPLVLGHAHSGRHVRRTARRCPERAAVVRRRLEQRCVHPWRSGVERMRTGDETRWRC